MKRREFLRGAAGAALASAFPHFGKGTEARRAKARPNFLFIMVDDLGYADLGCYGSRAIRTPHIDRLASEGVRFTQAYSGCTVCAPARSVLMTGYHMGHTAVRGNSGGIPIRREDVTVAEVLEAAGYACGGFGKWGLGDVGTEGVPEKQGFDVFFGYYHQVHAHDYYPAYLWRNSAKVPLPGNAGGKRGQYSHYLIFEETERFIRRNRDRPFFCYAPWTPPHGRYEIPEKDPAWAPYEDRPWPDPAKVVAAMVSMIDRHVGRLLDLLEERGIEDRTVVFFTSDNGAARRFDGILDSCGPLRGLKRDLYEGGIRVPMIVRWPGKIRAGRTSRFPWYFADVLPTLAELSGARMPRPVDGISVVPELSGEDAGRKQAAHPFLYWEFGRGRARGKQAVRMGDWKAVRPRTGVPLELYDLREDTGEKRDLAKERPEIVKRIEAILAHCRTEPRPQIEPAKPKGRRYR